MLKSYLKSALRHVRRQPLYAMINLAGLAIGLAGTMLILLYVQRETSYDRFHQHADRIVRVAVEANYSGNERRHCLTSARLGPTLAQEFPEVEQYVRLGLVRRETYVRQGEKLFREKRLLFADSTFFEVFDFPLIAGNPQSALRAKQTLVLTESAARRYFGDENPLGRSLTIELGRPVEFQVTGVMRDVPENSHLRFEMVISFVTLPPLFYGPIDRWLRQDFYTYLLLADAAAAEQVSAKLPAFYQRHMAQEFAGIGSSLRFFLQPLTDIHLRSHLEHELEANGDLAYVMIFSLVAVLILAIACINFMNLATARASKRAREVGMRKVVGARRSELVRQFLGEALVFAALAFLLALALTWLLLPLFNNLAGYTLQPADLLQPSLLVPMLLLAVLAGMLAGSYPALLLASFRPIVALKGRQGVQGKRGRQVLVVAQFFVSVFLIAGTLAVIRQVDYMRTKKLGFAGEQIVAMPIRDAGMRQRLDAIKGAMESHPGVKVVSASSGLPGGIVSVDGIKPKGAQEVWVTNMLWVDFDFIEAMGMRMVAGRSFDRQFTTDVDEAFILNERAIAALGWQQSWAEQEIEWQGPRHSKRGRVIGIVEDFHFKSLHLEVEPIVLQLDPAIASFVLARIDPLQAAEALDGLASVWQQFAPAHPFDYFFLSDEFNKLYQTEEKLQTIFLVFSVLAIAIACLGLFGLAAFAAEQRTKEIGIRKVLGATPAGIAVLLSGEFARLVLLSLLFAFPAAWFAIQRWLSGFAYRASIDWSLFVLAALLALGIAMLTVSFQVIRASLADPVRALRHE